MTAHQVAGAHDSAVTVYDIVVEDGRPWIVMERVYGRTLAEVRAERGTLGAVEAARTLVGIADALVAAHGKGVLHRDIKPSNIMLRDDGRAVLMDFGVAYLAGKPDLTRSGEMVEGTSPFHRDSLEATAAAVLKGQVTVQRDGIRLIVVAGRDRAVGEGDPPGYQKEQELELTAYRTSTWSMQGDVRTTRMGMRLVTRAKFTWLDASGMSVYARNTVILADGRWPMADGRWPMAAITCSSSPGPRPRRPGSTRSPYRPRPDTR